MVPAAHTWTASECPSGDVAQDGVPDSSGPTSRHIFPALRVGQPRDRKVPPAQISGSGVPRGSRL
jgi:hypothetical protein